jgi:hypothetical protein
MPRDGTIVSTAIIRDEKTIAKVHTYAMNKAKIATLEKANVGLKTTILAAMNGRDAASVGTHVVQVTMVPGTPGTPNRQVTKAMIGYVIIGKPATEPSTRLVVK